MSALFKALLPLNIILLAIAVVSGCLIIIYTYLSHLNAKRRQAKLNRISEHMKALVAYKDKLKECAEFISELTGEELFAVVKNSETAFEKDSRDRFKKCVIDSPKRGSIERVALNSANKWRRIQALLSLSFIEGPKAVPILKKGLFDKDPDVSYFSLIALGKLKKGLSARILLNFISEFPQRSHRIASLLEYLPAEEAKTVIEALNGENEKVRYWALKIISKIKPDNALEKVIALCSDPSADVRAAAIECLGAYNDSSSASRFELIKALKDQAWYVRMHAVRALVKIFGRDIYPDILAHLEDDSWLVRESVKKALAGDVEPALEHLKEGLCLENKQVRLDCAQVLEESGSIARMLKNLIGDDSILKGKALSLLNCLLDSGLHLGLESELRAVNDSAYAQIMQIITGLNPKIAEKISENLRAEHG